MTQKLKTETNTPCMERRVVGAFLSRFHREDSYNIQADFEHGQWWVTDLESGEQWSVIDAEGGEAVDGFDFEQL